MAPAMDVARSAGPADSPRQAAAGSAARPRPAARAAEAQRLWGTYSEAWEVASCPAACSALDHRAVKEYRGETGRSVLRRHGNQSHPWTLDAALDRCWHLDRKCRAK